MPFTRPGGGADRSVELVREKTKGSGLFVVNHWALGERCETKSPDPFVFPKGQENILKLFSWFESFSVGLGDFCGEIHYAARLKLIRTHLWWQLKELVPGGCDGIDTAHILHPSNLEDWLDGTMVSCQAKLPCKDPAVCRSVTVMRHAKMWPIYVPLLLPMSLTLKPTCLALIPVLANFQITAELGICCPKVIPFNQNKPDPFSN